MESTYETLVHAVTMHKFPFQLHLFAGTLHDSCGVKLLLRKMPKLDEG